MTGAPPYNAQSPTQQHRFAAYDSPTKNRPFFPNDQPQGQQQQPFSQHPPQTPPAFGPSSVPRSPRFSHASSPLPSTLPPPLNGTAPPPHSSHTESSSKYPGPSGTANPGLPLPRPFSSSTMSGNGTSPYGPSTPHGHPSGRPDSHSQSPTRESDSPYGVRGNGVGYGPSAPKAASPPRESVCLQSHQAACKLRPKTPSNQILLYHRSLRARPIPCPSRAFSLGPRKNSLRGNRLLHPPLPPLPPRPRQNPRAANPKPAQPRAHSSTSRTKDRQPKNLVQSRQGVSSLPMACPSQHQSWRALRHARHKGNRTRLMLMPSK